MKSKDLFKWLQKTSKRTLVLNENKMEPYNIKNSTLKIFWLVGMQAIFPYRLCPMPK